MSPSERGFALVAVLLVLGLLGVVGAEFAYSMRLEASALRVWKDHVTAAHLAEAAVAQALRELSAPELSFTGIADDGLLSFLNRERVLLPRLPRSQVPLGVGAFSYRITDEQGRLNVNTASADRLGRLLECLGIDKIARDPIVDAILDWIDTNDEHRLHGAESDDHYLKLPTPYRARNGRIESIHELLQIKGVTPKLFWGADDRPGLVDVLTTRGGGAVNVNTAGPVVLCAMGVSEAEIEEFRQSRRDGIIPAVPGRLGGRGFTTTTTTYRIDAEGLVDGRSRANVTAIVQRRGGPAASLVMVEWSGIR